MMNFLFGALTFLPPNLAAKPSEWLRAAVEWVKARASVD